MFEYDDIYDDTYDDEDDDTIMFFKKHNISISNNTTFNEYFLNWVDILSYNIDNYETFREELNSGKLQLTKAQLDFILDYTDIEYKVNMNNLNKFKEIIF